MICSECCHIRETNGGAVCFVHEVAVKMSDVCRFYCPRKSATGCEVRV